MGRVSQICSSFTPFFRFPVLTGFGGATATHEKIVDSMVKALRTAVKVFKAVSFILNFFFFSFAFLHFCVSTVSVLFKRAKKRKTGAFCMSSFFQHTLTYCTVNGMIRK